MMSKRGNITAKLAKRIAAEAKGTASLPITDIEECDESTTKSKYFSSISHNKIKRKENESSIIGKSLSKLKKPLNIDENLSSNRKTSKNEESWEPENWHELLENIRKMRVEETAPVDSMGCHKCADDTADEKTQRYQKLVALMLSSQTKDDVTFEAMNKLKSNNLTPESICDMKLEKLQVLLYPVSFYKNKAKFIKNTSRILVDKYNSDIPTTIKELVALPGVGPKMAHICMATAWNIITGIGVDIHVHRISNRLCWVPKPTKQPEQTRIALEKWLPKDLWAEVNHLLVGFGQTICTPLRPKCSQCLNCDICPSSVSRK